MLESLEYFGKYFVAYALAVYYNIKIGAQLLLYAVLKPFEKPFQPKLRSKPPAPLTDPRYGTHKFINVNGVKLHYVESGNSSKELMLFVHGYPEFWYSWRYQLVEFSKDYWCIAIDQRGYGDSDKPGNVSDYELNNMVDDIKALVNALGREKCILVGHDWGSVVSWGVRARHPDCVRAHVSMAGSSLPSFQHLMWSTWAQFRKSWYMLFFQGPYIPELAAIMLDFYSLGNILKKSNVSDEDIECFKYTFGKPGALTPPINYYRANFLKFKNTKEGDDLPIPMLCIRAEKDLYVGHSLADIMKSRYRNVEIETVKNASHFVQQDAPAEVNRILREFLKSKSL